MRRSGSRWPGHSPSSAALSNVLLDTFSLPGPNGFGPGLAPRAGATLVSGLHGLGGAAVYPLYLLPQAANPNYQGQYIGVVSCPVLRDLAVHAPPQVSTRPGVDATPPRTYGEAVAIRSGRATVLQRLVYFAVALTMLVAGCSLAVAIGGGLADRKRPFTLLRVSGTPVRTLYRVLLLEAVVPLAAATVVTAGLAYGMSVLAVMQMAPPGTPVPLLGHVYFATMGAGLAIALVVIGVTLPLLNRMTGPDNARFE